MEVRLAGGALIDIATRDDVDAIGESIRDMLRRQEGQSNIRRDMGTINTGPVGALGSTYAIDCGGPPSGRVRDIRTLAVYGYSGNGDPFLAVNAQAVLLVSSTPPSAQNFDPGAIASEPFALPVGRYFGRGSLILDARAHLYVWVKLGAALPNTTLIAAYTAVEASTESDLMEDI